MMDIINNKFLKKYEESSVGNGNHWLREDSTDAWSFFVGALNTYIPFLSPSVTLGIFYFPEFSLRFLAIASEQDAVVNVKSAGFIFHDALGLESILN